MNSSGSSVLARALEGCRRVVGFPAEGQTFFEDAVGFDRKKDAMPAPDCLGVSRIWTERAEVFEDPRNYDWKRIKDVWHREWAKHPNYLSVEENVFLEKSPPNVLRADLLAEHFPGATFLLMIRDPYAVVEGIRRREGYSLERCANHWVRASQRQLVNRKLLPRSLFLSYESLCADPTAWADAIRGHMAGLEDLDLTQKIASRTLDGIEERPLEDLNPRQIARLSLEQRAVITACLRPHHELVEQFGYRLRD